MLAIGALAASMLILDKYTTNQTFPARVFSEGLLNRKRTRTPVFYRALHQPNVLYARNLRPVPVVRERCVRFTASLLRETSRRKRVPFCGDLCGPYNKRFC